jgi:hypothetical protein
MICCLPYWKSVCGSDNEGAIVLIQQEGTRGFHGFPFKILVISNTCSIG